MTVTKSELANSLHETLGLNKRESKEFVEEFFETIRSQLESGVTVKLSGFGNFGLRDKSARPGRNPKTGEDVAISARRIVAFKASQKLKEAVDINADNIKRLLVG